MQRPTINVTSVDEQARQLTYALARYTAARRRFNHTGERGWIIAQWAEIIATLIDVGISDNDPWPQLQLQRRRMRHYMRVARRYQVQ